MIGCGHSTSRRVPALKAWSPDFKIPAMQIIATIIIKSKLVMIKQNMLLGS
jgi:hypothetical protein